MSNIQRSYKTITIRLETNAHVRGCILLNLLGIPGRLINVFKQTIYLSLF